MSSSATAAVSSAVVARFMSSKAASFSSGFASCMARIKALSGIKSPPFCRYIYRDPYDPYALPAAPKSGRVGPHFGRQVEKLGRQILHSLHVILVMFLRHVLHFFL